MVKIWSHNCHLISILVYMLISKKIGNKKVLLVCTEIFSGCFPKLLTIYVSTQLRDIILEK